MSACLIIVATVSFYGFRTVMVPVDCIQGNNLCPHPLNQFDFKEFFQKTPLLQGHSFELQKMDGWANATNNKKQNLVQTITY